MLILTTQNVQISMLAIQNSIINIYYQRQVDTNITDGLPNAELRTDIIMEWLLRGKTKGISQNVYLGAPKNWESENIDIYVEDISDRIKNSIFKH